MIEPEFLDVDGVLALQEALLQEHGGQPASGIYVRMYDDDHPPPHIQVEYQGHEAFVDISSGEVLEGHLPKNAARLVRDWCLEIATNSL